MTVLSPLLSRCTFCIVKLLSLWLAVACGAYAQTVTWTGAGANTNWTTTANWSTGALPADAASLVFGTATSSQNITLGANRLASDLTFNSSYAYTLTGNQLQLSSTGTDFTMNASGNVLIASNLTGPNGLTFAGTGTGTATISGVISGTGALVKNGSFALILSGNNTYTGATTVNAGTLRLGASNRIYDSSAVTVASGSIFDLNGYQETVGSIAGAGNITLAAGALTAGGDNSSTTFSGVISGTGGLVKAGSGTLILSGSNTYSGATQVNAGTLQLGAANALASSTALIIASGATFDTSWGNSQTVASLSGAGSLNIRSNTFTVGDSTNSTFSGSISDSYGSLVKVGTGVLTLSGNSTFTGLTTINQGAIAVTSATALGGSTYGNVIADGAALYLGNNITLSEGSFDISGAGPNNLGALRSISGSNSYSGALNLKAATSLGADAGASLSIAGQLSLAYPLTITGDGSSEPKRTNLWFLWHHKNGYRHPHLLRFKRKQFLGNPGHQRRHGDFRQAGGHEQLGRSYRHRRQFRSRRVGCTPARSLGSNPQ